MKRMVWLGLLVGLAYSLWAVLVTQAAPTLVALHTVPTQVGTTLRFAAIGDFGSNSNNALAVSNLVKSWHPNLVITLGDNNYPDGAASTIDKNIGKYYREYIYPYVGTYGAGASENYFYPALGNHDWTALQIISGSVIGPHFDYFVLPGNERYYDFVQGPVHFFVLDSDPKEPDGISSTSAQANWLRNRLSQSTAPWQVVYMHHAPYSSGLHGSTTTLRWPYKAWGADLVMSGHDHLYERLSVDNMPYIVNGMGGVALYNFVNILPESQVRYNAKHGAVLVDANPTTLTIQAYAIDGLLIDQYTLGAVSGNQAPTVAITSPVNGAILPVGASTVITASASDADGSISQVLFQANGVPIAGCIDSNPPYECSWTPAPGNYLLTASATDNLNLSTSSAPITVTVGAGDPCAEVPRLVLNEIMYNPSSTLNSDDWVEIHNPHGNPLNLANWILQDSMVDFVFPISATIPANGYLVAVKDYTLFRRIYPSITNLAAPLPFRFSNTGELVRLLSPTRCVIAEVTYGVSAPWPTTPNAGGPSLSMLAPNLNNTLTASWVASTGNGGTPGTLNFSEAANQPPLVTITIPISGASVIVGNPLSVTATISDSDGTVSQVIFRDNGTTIVGCTATADPYSCVYTPTLGTHLLTAVATDDDNANTTSTVVMVTVTESAPFLEQDGQVVMEAENYHATVGRSLHDWLRETSKPGYSGVGAMVTAPNNGTKIVSTVITTSPEIQYRVQFSTTGTYYVWLRTWADVMEDNSVWDGIDSLLRDEYFTAYGDNLWTWSVHSFVVSATGVHTVSLWMREDGLYVDRLLMTKDSKFIPSGIGPAESPRVANLLVAETPVLVEPAGEERAEYPAPLAAPFSVQLLAPSAGEEVGLVSPVTLLATLESADPTQTSSAEEAEMLFYANDKVIATCDATSAPHDCTWQPAPGVYNVTVVAFVDNERIPSAPVTLRVVDTEAERMHQVFLPFINR